METAFITTPIGTLRLEGSKEGLHTALFIDQPVPETSKVPAVLKDAVQQLRAYFNEDPLSRKRTPFTLKLAPQGTDFQQSVWKLLETIPYAKTTTYMAMANALGDPKVIRAAASANGRNPIAIIIPCHRVIGSDGSLTGYAGGLQRKKWLLEHESSVKQISLF